MQRIPLLFITLAILLPPLFASAAGSCLASGQSVTLTSVKDAKSQSQSQITCADLCSDEKVTLLTERTFGIKSGVTMTDVVTRLCKTPEDKEKYGCNPGQIKPRVVLVMIDDTTKTLTFSKCEKSALTSALNKSIDSGDTKPLEQLASQQAESLKAPPAINAGTDALASALTGLGVPADQARTIANSAISAGDLIKALQSNDPNVVSDAVKKAASDAGITINPDLLNSISRMTPEEAAAKVASLEEALGIITGDPTRGFDTAGGGGTAPQGGVWADTFKGSEDRAGISGSVPGYLAGTAKIESNGNPNVCSPTGPCGLFQYTKSTWNEWSARWNLATNGNPNPLPLNARFDPQLSSDVTAFYAATNLQRYGDLIQQSGMDPKAALYAIHNIGDYGGPRFIQAFAQNPNLLVRDVLDDDSIRHNPRLYAGGNITLAQAQQNMLAGMSGSTNFTGRSSYPYSTGSGGQYTPPSFFGGDLMSMLTGGASPFGNVTPGYSLMQTGTPAQYAQPSVQQQQTQGGSSSQSQSFPGQTTQFPTQTNVPVVQPAAILIAQPKTVARGSSIQVSWSTVGMRPDVPCRVLINEVFLFAEGNEGTKFATTTASTAIGPWTFTLECMAMSGVPIRQTASVDIR